MAEPGEAGYALEAQVGHLLRRAHQRATAIFLAAMQEHQVTPTQWAALAKLREEGSLSQNHLGRLTAMDPATIQGVSRRLIARKLVCRQADPDDRRRAVLRLTEAGERLVDGLYGAAFGISQDTLAPLSETERETFLSMLRRLS
ncbi:MULTISPECIES: MarR family winged helix-turn-helix transcriptional regulator [Oceanibaculum]|uniref:Transcriptional regulator n=1 Tax=Oceanibaculum indicum P24 TaxID=1207063 RepID=K2J2R8_9PROT|nr:MULTISPECIES: MarR family transcriptional regulator [Oceanibaculum]EKE77276.1 transcriptional regulator [Oceanibaculum indicum P24]MCH2395653.1 MarR family transcriptional regulator [Oceanibaculum sp.]